MVDYRKWPPDNVWVEDYLPWIEGRCIPERRLNLKDGEWVSESRYPAPDPDEENSDEEMEESTD